jgi:hypothetical protein
MALAGSGKVTAEIRSLNVALTNSESVAKSAKSTVKPFLVLIAASALTWAAFMAIHGLS